MDSRLTQDQINELRRAHRSTKDKKAADRIKAVYSFLSVDPIIEYVEKNYGVKYSVSGITQLLRRLDFVYKKAKIITGKADAEKQSV